MKLKSRYKPLNEIEIEIQVQIQVETHKSKHRFKPKIGLEPRNKTEKRFKPRFEPKHETTKMIQHRPLDSKEAAIETPELNRTTTNTALWIRRSLHVRPSR